MSENSSILVSLDERRSYHASKPNNREQFHLKYLGHEGFIIEHTENLHNPDTPACSASPKP